MILVDHRSGSVEVAPLLQDSNICHLVFGDFAFSGKGPNGQVNIGVERKTLLDFLNSMTTNRLSGHQIIGLTQNYEWVYIIVEGIWRADRRTGLLQRNRRGGWVVVSQGSRTFMARDVYKFINTLQVLCNIIVVTTNNIQGTASWLDACYSWWNKEWKRHKSHLQFHEHTVHTNLVKPNLVTRMASQFAGIGLERARELGEKFKTPADMMKATKKELIQIKGIGSKLADSIMGEIND